MQPESSHDGNLSPAQSGDGRDLWSAFREAVARRRSIRAFLDRPVPREAVRGLLEAACLAPSSGNVQPWHFYVVTDLEKRRQLAAATYPGADCRSSQTQAWVEQAPVIIVVCFDWPRGAAKYNFEHRYFSGIEDVSAAIQTILLGAAAMGLGACWVGGIRFVEVARALDIPPVHEPIALIPVGYPSRAPGPRQTRPLDEVATWLE